MPVIEIHIKEDELASVRHLAEELHMQPEDIAYAGLNLIMLCADEPEIRSEITQTCVWRRIHPPKWSG
jgi:hypothetical protein